MKNLLFTALVGFAMVAVTGCTTGSNANAGSTGSKCAASGKCDGAKKCAASGKCGESKAKKAVAKKCSSGKCGK